MAELFKSSLGYTSLFASLSLYDTSLEAYKELKKREVPDFSPGFTRFYAIYDPTIQQLFYTTSVQADVNAGGSDTQIQYNRDGVLTGSSQFFVDNSETPTQLTFEGSISASANLFAGIAESTDTNFKTVVIDPTTGQFFRTGGYAGGGGGGGTVGTLQQVTDLGNNTTNAISSSGLRTTKIHVNAGGIQNFIIFDPEGTTGTQEGLIQLQPNSANKGPEIVLQTSDTDDDRNIYLKAGGITFAELDYDDEGATKRFFINPNSVDIDFVAEGNNDDSLLFVNAGTDKVGIGYNAPSQKLSVDGGIYANGHITASGTVSASGTTDNSFGGRVVLDNDVLLAGKNTVGSVNSLIKLSSANTTEIGNTAVLTEVKGTRIKLTANVTASALISASGELFFSASDSDGNHNNVLTYDTSTGRVYYTGSYGGGGGGGGTVGTLQQVTTEGASTTVAITGSIISASGGFIGDLTGTASHATLADSASKIRVADSNANAGLVIPFLSAVDDFTTLGKDTNNLFLYNPGACKLSIGTPVHATSSILINGNITASSNTNDIRGGNISASNDIFGKNFEIDRRIRYSDNLSNYISFNEVANTIRFRIGSATLDVKNDSVVVSPLKSNIDFKALGSSSTAGDDRLFIVNAESGSVQIGKARDYSDFDPSNKLIVSGNFIHTGSYNVTGDITASDGFIGDLTGTASHATVADKIKINNSTSDASFSIPFFAHNTNPCSLIKDQGADLQFNPHTTLLNVGFNQTTGSIQTAFISASDDAIISGSLTVGRSGSVSNKGIDLLEATLRTRGRTRAVIPSDTSSPSDLNSVHTIGEDIQTGVETGVIRASGSYDSDGKLNPFLFRTPIENDLVEYDIHLRSFYVDGGVTTIKTKAVLMWDSASTDFSANGVNDRATEIFSNQGTTPFVEGSSNLIRPLFNSRFDISGSNTTTYAYALLNGGGSNSPYSGSTFEMIIDYKVYRYA